MKKDSKYFHVILIRITTYDGTKRYGKREVRKVYEKSF